MSITLVSTPIGNPDDITLRAIETLKTADIIIGEELKPTRVLLKKLGIENKEVLQLNEHSRPEDLLPLVELCKGKTVALVTDCGTPGFCDPGADLVQACYANGIKVDVNPGASSLMALLSLSGVKLDSFYFVGFLPAEKIERARAIKKLSAIKEPLVVMDTPYRLKSTLNDLSLGGFSERRCILGIDLTGLGHKVERDTLKVLAAKDWGKAPFVLLVGP